MLTREDSKKKLQGSRRKMMTIDITFKYIKSLVVRYARSQKKRVGCAGLDASTDPYL